MIRRRDIGYLGALSGFLAVLAVAAILFVADGAERLQVYYSSSDFAVRNQEEFFLLQVGTEATARAFPWVVLAALIPAIAALALATIRAQAGSASARASRDASAASSRS